MAGIWRFSAEPLCARGACGRLERDFDAVPELAALVADLLEEMDTLRAQILRGTTE